MREDEALRESVVLKDEKQLRSRACIDDFCSGPNVEARGRRPCAAFFRREAVITVEVRAAVAATVVQRQALRVRSTRSRGAVKVVASFAVSTGSGAAAPTLRLAENAPGSGGYAARGGWDLDVACQRDVTVS